VIVVGDGGGGGGVICPALLLSGSSSHHHHHHHHRFISPLPPGHAWIGVLNSDGGRLVIVVMAEADDVGGREGANPRCVF